MDKKKRNQQILRLVELFQEAEDQGRKVSEFLYEDGLYRSTNEKPSIDLIEEENRLVPPFADLLESLHLSALAAVLDRGGGPLIDQFYQRFGMEFKKNHASTEYDIDHDGSGAPYIKYLVRLRQFLSSVAIPTHEFALDLATGVKYLERILQASNHIIAMQGIVVSRETDVSNGVRRALNLVFPSTARGASFARADKRYIPDICIPELSTAVEYKYASKEQDLSIGLDDLATDVKAYVNDPAYDQFYAVIYATSEFVTLDRLTEMWNFMKFPSNWKVLYVVASSELRTA